MRFQARSGLLTVRWEWRPSRGHQRGVDSIQVSRKPQGKAEIAGPILGYTVLSGPHGFRTTQASVGQVAFRSPPVCWGHAIGTADRCCRGALVRRTDGRRQHRTGWSARWPRGGNSNPSPSAAPPRALHPELRDIRERPGILERARDGNRRGQRADVVKCLASVLIW